ncbi:MAG: NnrU family protein, partial [Pseudomonadales bacterium]
MLFYLGLGCFFGAHSVGLLPPVRRALTDKLTERGYMGAYTLISVLGMALMVAGYSSQTFIQWGV